MKRHRNRLHTDTALESVVTDGRDRLGDTGKGKFAAACERDIPHMEACERVGKTFERILVEIGRSIVFFSASCVFIIEKCEKQ